MTRMKKQFKIDRLFALILFAVFAVLVVSLILTGSDVYKKITEKDSSVYDRRTAVQYISAKVHSADVYGSIEEKNIGETNVLVLTEEIDGEIYNTYIYCHNDYIMELFTEADLDFAPENGSKILKAKSVRFELEGESLSAEIVHSDDTKEEIMLSLRSGREVF